MKTTQQLLVFILFSVVFISCTNQNKKDTITYYFDAVNGNNKNQGTYPDKPFKNLSIIKNLPLKAGDSVLLKSGVVFEEQLYVSCKGDSANPVVIGKYGGDAKPHIKANGQYNDAVHVFNSEHIVVRDLEISNKG